MPLAVKGVNSMQRYNNLNEYPFLLLQLVIIFREWRVGKQKVQFTHHSTAQAKRQ